MPAGESDPRADSAPRTLPGPCAKHIQRAISRLPAPAGLVGAGAAAAPALLVEPLLPLTPAVHGVVVGIAAVHGYAVGVAVAAGWRWASAATAHTARCPHTPPAGCDGTRRCVLWAAAGAGLAVVAAVRATVGAVVLVAVAVAVLVLAVSVARSARVVRAAQMVCAARAAVRLLIRPSTRSLHPWGRGRVAVALGLVAALSMVVPGATATATATAVERGPAKALGSEGRVFLTGGPDAAAIAAATETPACTPVRAYVGLGAAAAPAERARRAVAELERAGGFARSAVLVVVPTGSGWVNPAAVTAAEHLAGGDLATVAVQYAARPSWQEYLLGAGAAQDSAVALVAALRERLDRIAPAQRPRLLLYGESLGALGARAAAPAADAVLVAGVPAAGWERDGDLRVRAVANVDDPVVWFSPRLLVARPTGWPGTWMPVVSFWQTAGSLLSALAAPPGHGHRYGAELADAWRANGVGAATPSAAEAMPRACCEEPPVAEAVRPGRR